MTEAAGATIRSVSVRFDADIASYLAKCRIAAAATDAAFPNSQRLADTNRAIGDQTAKVTEYTTATEKSTRATEGNTRATSKARAEVRGLGSDIDSTSRKLDNGGKEIDKLSGRLGILVDVGLALGPALIPVLAEAAPLTATLGADIGFLAIGAGTTVLAFHGLGDALTKFNKAALDPTETNINNARLAMDKLPPSAQRMVLELHRLGPEVQRLQRIAANGLLPGVRDGLHDLEGDLPIVRTALRGTAFELGDIARDTGQALSSRRWRPFLNFLAQETPRGLNAIAQATGHVGHGVAELVLGFRPLIGETDQGIVNLAADFDRWATSVGKTQGFQDFLDYLRENGPRVLELLGETGKTLVDIGTAVAPLGGPTIDILTNLLEVVDGIANSDLGTPLFAGLVAIRLYGRVAQLAGVQVETSFKGVATAQSQIGTKLSSVTEQTTRWSRTTIADIQAVTRAYALAGRASLTNPSRSVAMSQERLKSRFGTALKGGLAASGLALIGSGAADSIGLTNTATLTLAGSLAGPVGAAVGGAIGYTLDLAHADDKVVDSTHRLQAAVKGLDFGQQEQAFADLSQQTDAFWQEIDQFKGLKSSFQAGPIQALQTLGDGVNEFFTHSHAEAEQALQDAGNLAARSKTAFTLIHDSLNTDRSTPFVDQTAGVSTLPLTLDELQRTAERTQPAMLALGITVEDLQAASEAGDGSLERLVRQITNYTTRADTASGRTKAVAAAFAGLTDQTVTLEDRISALSTALDAALGPKLGLEAARGQVQQGLNDLAKNIKGNSIDVRNAAGRLTDAAISNRSAIQDQVTSIEGLINAQAKAGVAPEKMTASLKDQRQALINTGVAAGISRQRMEEYVNQLGLTPKFVQTAINLVGTTEASRKLDQLTHRRTVYVDVVTRQGHIDQNTTGGHVLRADGGTIPGDRSLGYYDRTPVLAAPGEFMVSNRHGQVDRNADLLAAINSNRYAGGGFIGGAPSRLASTASSSGGGSAVRVAFPNGMTLVGTFDTPQGPGMMRAIAVDTYHTERAADARFEEARA